MAFTSNREKLLWLASASIVVAVFLTMPIVPRIADLLGSWKHLNDTFFLCFLIVMATVLGTSINKWRTIQTLSFAVGITIIYAMIILRWAAGPTHRTHLFEYTLVAALIYQALFERNNNLNNIRRPWLVAFLSATGIGMLDEVIQGILPNRVFDVVDIGFNSLAAFLGVGIGVILNWVQNRFK